MKGKFISFEGVDGSGKSTILKWFVDECRAGLAGGIEVISTREPGGTELGEKIRTLLLTEDMDPATEVALFIAGRTEHIARVIKPALAAGKWVVTDRYTDSNYAFQVGGRGVDVKMMDAGTTHFVKDFLPDVTFLFDLPVEIAKARMVGSRDALDRFEREGEDFHNAVRCMYLKRARESNGRIIIIDASQSIDDIKKAMLEHMFVMDSEYHSK